MVLFKGHDDIINEFVKFLPCDIQSEAAKLLSSIQQVQMQDSDYPQPKISIKEEDGLQRMPRVYSIDE